MLSPEAAISVVEAAYDLDAGEEAWQRAITTALALAGIELASSIGPEVFGLLASDGRRLSIEQRRRWQRVAAHVSTAAQLRQALASAPDAARAQSSSACLRAAAIASLENDEHVDEEARKPGAAWSALASGSWSLVDLFEAGGRSVVIALRNPADAQDPRALTAREREVAERAAAGSSGKEIAYELGLRTPTVSQLLQRAVRKLRAASAVQLGSVVRALGQSRNDSGSST
jgi:DNA-binding NarL/FixJ family response regulator